MTQTRLKVGDKIFCDKAKIPEFPRKTSISYSIFKDYFIALSFYPVTFCDNIFDGRWKFMFSVQNRIVKITKFIFRQRIFNLQLNK